MKARKGMFKIKRNMQICRGLDNCESKACLKHLPGLEKGSISVAAWALEHNAQRIDMAIMSCPEGAIQLEGI